MRAGCKVFCEVCRGRGTYQADMVEVSRVISARGRLPEWGGNLMLSHRRIRSSDRLLFFSVGRGIRG